MSCITEDNEQYDYARLRSTGACTSVTPPRPGCTAIDVDTVLPAAEYQERHQLTFWDGIIIAAAVQASATVLLTKDLNHGQTIDPLARRLQRLSANGWLRGL